MAAEQRKVLLIILDGWGLNKDYPGNAITQAKTPYWDQLWSGSATAQLAAAGEAVGLPPGQMGTSEANHFTIGAGKVVHQDLVRVNKSIADGEFFTRPALNETFEHVKRNNSALHVWGIISDGGVHSVSEHTVATVEAAHQAGVEKIYVHVVTDGRDASPTSGIEHVQHLEKELQRIGAGQIVSLVGRYYAMDRDQNMERTDQAFDLYTQGKGQNFITAAEAVQASYDQEVTDEFIKPAVIGEGMTVKDHDAWLMVNFRSDRPRQLVSLFLEKGPADLCLTTMTQYNSEYPVKVIFEPIYVETTLGLAISQAGLKQLRITETEKAAHLTFFLNCKREEPYEGEDRQVFESYDDIATHDERPEMRAPEIAQRIVDDIEAEKYEVIFTNICNGDMVGHTGKIPATIEACEAVDAALAKIIPVAQAHGFDIMVTADHGNCEEMLTDEGEVITSHSTLPVPFILISDRHQQLNRDQGTVGDIAATMLTLLDLPVPAEMTGQSLV